MGKKSTFSSKYYNQQKIFNVSVEQQNSCSWGLKHTNKFIEKTKDLQFHNWWLGPVSKKSSFSSKYYNQQKLFNVSVEQQNSSSWGSKQTNEQINKFLLKTKDL